MHARTTTLQARAGAVDDMVRLVEELMGPVGQIDGNLGMSMLADRDTGRCIITSSWTDEATMQASAEAVRPMRDRLAEHADEPWMVQEWEIAVLHRKQATGAGACARVSWLQGQPEEADTGISLYRSQVVPALDELPGFCSASLLVDRGSGRSVSSVAYESRDMLMATRQAAEDLRNRTVQQLHSHVYEVAEFELVLSHLRVPELV
jgi:quinol monooxygenase YgiN